MPIATGVPALPAHTVGAELPPALRDAPPSLLVYSVDIEGSGACKTNNYMLELGAVAFVAAPRSDGSGREWHAVSHFSRALTAPTPEHGFDSKCRAEFWSRPDNAAHLRELLRDGAYPRTVMESFAAWLDSFRAARYVQLSDLPQYDSAWIDMYHERYTDERRPLYLRYEQMHSAICTDSVMRALTGDALSPWVSTADACRAAGVEYFQPERAHQAVHDAYAIGVNFLRVATAKGWCDKYLAD